jgi:hypothetical protein
MTQEQYDLLKRVYEKLTRDRVLNITSAERAELLNLLDDEFDFYEVAK